ncbi:MAG: hypothetical protein KJZ54_14740 [Phycisphaerales bacterium]|nr:hypothetical protein [Phycisphaerales bacterium]
MWEQTGFDPLDFIPRLDPAHPPEFPNAEQIDARLDEIAALLTRLERAGTPEKREAVFDAIWSCVEADRTQIARIACGLVRAHRHSWRHSLEELSRTRELIDRLARLGG